MPDATDDAITVRLAPEKRDELNELSRRVARSRSDLINEAIDAYLDTNRWQHARIVDGVRQADAGEFASDEDVADAFARWR